MALAYVGYASATTTSVALPTFVAGDLAIVHAYRDSGNAAPALPAGWTSPTGWSSGANQNSSRLGYRVLQGGDTTTGVWANATEVQVLVVRGQHLSTPVGTPVPGGVNNSNNVTYNPVRVFGDPVRSWVVGFAGHKTATNVRDRTATGMAVRSAAGVATSLACHTQASGFTFYPDTSEWWFDARSFIVNTSAAWRSYAVEVQEYTVNQTQTATAVISLAPGFPPTDRNGHVIYVRARKTNAAHTGVIRAQLFENTTPRSSVLSTTVLTTTLTQYALPISEAEALQIGSYAELEVRFNGYSSEGTPTVFEVDQVWLSTPDAVAPATAPVFPNLIMLSLLESYAGGGEADTNIYPSPTLFPSESPPGP